MEYKSTKEELFDSIYRTYVEDVYRACLYISKNEDLSQEVTQQAFVNYYERFEKVKPECLKAYLIQAAKNLMKNYYRDNRRFVENDENVELPISDSLACESVEDQYIQAEERSAKQKLTWEILEDLKEGHENWYDILYMKYYKDMDYDEIATELNITKDVLYSRIRRAKVWLQKNYRIEFDNILNDIW